MQHLQVIHLSMSLLLLLTMVCLEALMLTVVIIRMDGIQTSSQLITGSLLRQ